MEKRAKLALYLNLKKFASYLIFLSKLTEYFDRKLSSRIRSVRQTLRLGLVRSANNRMVDVYSNIHFWRQLNILEINIQKIFKKNYAFFF